MKMSKGITRLLMLTLWISVLLAGGVEASEYMEDGIKPFVRASYEVRDQIKEDLHELDISSEDFEQALSLPVICVGTGAEGADVQKLSWWLPTVIRDGDISI